MPHPPAPADYPRPRSLWWLLYHRLTDPFRRRRSLEEERYSWRPTSRQPTAPLPVSVPNPETMRLPTVPSPSIARQMQQLHMPTGGPIPPQRPQPQHIPPPPQAYYVQHIPPSPQPPQQQPSPEPQRRQFVTQPLYLEPWRTERLNHLPTGTLSRSVRDAVISGEFPTAYAAAQHTAYWLTNSQPRPGAAPMPPGPGQHQERHTDQIPYSGQRPIATSVAWVQDGRYAYNWPVEYYAPQPPPSGPPRHPQQMPAVYPPRAGERVTEGQRYKRQTAPPPRRKRKMRAQMRRLS